MLASFFFSLLLVVVAFSSVPLSFPCRLYRQVLASGFHPDIGGISGGNAILRLPKCPGAGKDWKLSIHFTSTRIFIL